MAGWGTIPVDGHALGAAAHLHPSVDLRELVGVEDEDEDVWGVYEGEVDHGMTGVK